MAKVDYASLSQEEIDALEGKAKTGYDKWLAKQNEPEQELKGFTTGHAASAQPELFKVLRFKKGIRSVSIPYLKEGKVEWVDTFESEYDEKAQNTLFDFWNRMKAENPTFNIEAKKEKLFSVE